MSYIPIFLFDEEKKQHQGRDVVFRFSSYESAESKIQSILSKLVGSSVDFDLESSRYSFIDSDGKKQKPELSRHYDSLATGFYLGIIVIDDDGLSNLLETAVVEELLKEK